MPELTSHANSSDMPRRFYPQDLLSGLLVFLVALPLCLGIAEASDAPLFCGLLAGIVGGLVVGVLSGSHTSVSGPAAGLTAVVASQIASLETFEAFLVAVLLAGVIQLALGAIRAGTLAEYFPISVIKGLLAAIGVILILKMAPKVIGHDATLSFSDLDSVSQIQSTVSQLNPTAALIGVGSLVFLLVWARIPKLKASAIPAPLLVVVVGAVITLLLQGSAGDSKWVIPASHLVEVPVAQDMSDLKVFLTFPDFSALASSQVYVAAIVIAVVASLETLINLEAVDDIDPEGRVSPKNRELLAQGAGNIVCGLIGGLPITSVIIRSSVNIGAGVKTRMSTISHGFLLVGCVLAIPGLLNAIPLSALGAILLVTGFKLASLTLFRQMWSGGMNKFLPFVITVVAIVLIDLLVGVLIGLGIAIVFVLRGALQTPYSLQSDKQAGGDIHRLQLSNQATFLNQAKLSNTLEAVPAGSHVLLDATSTHHLDPDIESLLIEFITITAPEHDLKVSLTGFGGLTSAEGSAHFVEDAIQPDPGSGDSS
ncbi:MAG: SulP family inorganic anion transporter [Planctomycetota bacterium]|nr:SulP family inorganic anion transporter [Planctomycetota bacterium]